MIRWGTRNARCLIFGSVIACLGAAWQPLSAQGQSSSPDEDTQLWIYAIARVPLDEKTRLTFDATQRWREQRRGDEQQTYRVNLDHEVADGLRLGGGFGVFENGGNTELRAHQNMSLSLGRITSRTQLEQRFFDGAERMELRLRQRIGYTQPISADWRASLDGEYLGLVQTRNRNPAAARDQWRGRFIVTHEFSNSFAVGAAYLLIYTPQPERVDQVNHVPQLILTRSF